jgi:hypothetical protein
MYIYILYIYPFFFSHQTQLIESVDESQDTPDNQDASVEEAPQVEALEEEIERAPGGRNEEGTEVLDVANAEPVHVATPDHANKNQEVDEVPNTDETHQYRFTIHTIIEEQQDPAAYQDTRIDTWNIWNHSEMQHPLIQPLSALHFSN